MKLRICQYLHALRPYRGIVAFVAVLNDTIKLYFAARGHTTAEGDGRHLAWTRSLQLQRALWAKPYLDVAHISTSGNHPHKTSPN